MDTSPDSLSSVAKPVIYELITRIVYRGVMVKIVQTGRTLEQAAANLANGTSGSNHSKHVPRKLRGVVFAPFLAADLDKVDAIDLCPYSVWQLHGDDKLQWNVDDPAWAIIMEEAEKLDMRSGRRWRKPHDPGHCEMILTPGDRANVTEERTRRILFDAHGRLVIA